MNRHHFLAGTGAVAAAGVVPGAPVVAEAQNDSALVQAIIDAAARQPSVAGWSGIHYDWLPPGWRWHLSKEATIHSPSSLSGEDKVGEKERLPV
jgi:hypothetical protein